MADEELPDRDLYSSPDPSDRTLVDISTLPLTDEDGLEINVYDVDGYRVPRRNPRHDRNQPPCGLLANLTRVRTLFQEGDGYDPDDGDDDERMGEPATPVVINVYPQALTRSFGHFQADGVPLGFNPILKHINRHMAHNADFDQPVIRGVACQGYNHIQHALTNYAGGLELVHGSVTSSLAGINARTPKAKRAHAKILGSTLLHRPHHRVEGKLSKDGLPRAFRVEPVFVVDIMALKSRYRKGRLVSLPLLQR